MSYEPENHLPALERHLEAVQILVNAGFTEAPANFTQQPQDADQVEFGMPFVRGDDTYWLNYMSVPCVLQWRPND